MPRALPLGELSPQVTERARTVKFASAVAGHDPTREKAILENPQIFQNCKIKIMIPLTMRRAKRSAFKSSCFQTKTPALRGAERERRVFGDYSANSGVDR